MDLHIYNLTIEIAVTVGGLVRRISQHDPDLAKQLRRACASVSLNLNEGIHSQGGNRSARLYTAMGSAREVLACLDVAIAFGYVERSELVRLRDQLDRVVATLYKLIHRRR